jgi:hypothetical protein
MIKPIMAIFLALTLSILIIGFCRGRMLLGANRQFGQPSFFHNTF